MNRIAGIVAAVVGFIIAALSITEIVPGLTGTGIWLLMLGFLVIGLSFVSGPAQDETPRMSTAETILNIFISPAETFRNLRRHPRWLVVIILSTILTGTFAMLFMQRLTPERVINFTTDKTLELSIVANNPEARKNIEEQRPKAIADAKNPVLQAAQFVTSFSALVFFTAFFALIFFLFALAMGGKINYWQAFAVAAYAAFPFYFIRYVLSTVILYLKDPIEIHPLLGQGTLLQDSLNFLVVPGEHPALYVLLGAFSLLWFYWIFLSANGLKNAGEKMTPTAAWTAPIVIWVVMTLLFAGWVSLFPGFMS
jgi:hypothetical protein